MSDTNNQNIINPKSCIYNCNTRIYWNVSENAYFEVFTRKKHICPNRSKPTTTTATAAATNKPAYYNKRPWTNSQQPKTKMSNSFELLTGPIQDIQRKYEILSDIVITQYQGKVHGSQSHIINNNFISLVVYYEVPEGKREEVKQKFNSHFVYNNQQNYR